MSDKLKEPARLIEKKTIFYVFASLHFPVFGPFVLGTSIEAR